MRSCRSVSVREASDNPLPDSASRNLKLLLIQLSEFLQALLVYSAPECLNRRHAVHGERQPLRIEASFKSSSHIPDFIVPLCNPCRKAGESPPVALRPGFHIVEPPVQRPETAHARRILCADIRESHVSHITLWKQRLKVCEPGLRRMQNRRQPVHGFPDLPAPSCIPADRHDKAVHALCGAGILKGADSVKVSDNGLPVGIIARIPIAKISCQLLCLILFRNGVMVLQDAFRCLQGLPDGRLLICLRDVQLGGEIRNVLLKPPAFPPQPFCGFLQCPKIRKRHCAASVRRINFINQRPAALRFCKFILRFRQHLLPKGFFFQHLRKEASLYELLQHCINRLSG